jgi:hypothetical protein
MFSDTGGEGSIFVSLNLEELGIIGRKDSKGNLRG